MKKNMIICLTITIILIGLVLINIFRNKPEEEKTDLTTVKVADAHLS